jgi:phospholipase/carboxylesterase
MARASPAIIVSPKAAPCKAALIWLHGFGDGPEDWASRFSDLSARHHHLKRVHLRAPVLPQSCYGGSKVPSWGNYKDQDCTHVGTADYNNDEIVSAQISERFTGIMQELEEMDHVDSDRVILGGFSMGATAAAELALRYPKKLGGLIMLNGWLLPGARAAVETGSAKDLPVLVSHGSADEQVGFDCGQAAAELLEKAGAKVQFEVQEGETHVASGFGAGRLLAMQFVDSLMKSDAFE